MSEQRIETTLQNALWTSVSDAAVIFDSNLRIIQANIACQEIMGYAPNELQGKLLSDLSSGQQTADFYKAMQHKLLQIGIWQGNVWQRHKQGAIYQCEVVCKMFSQVFNHQETQNSPARKRLYLAVFCHKKSRAVHHYDPLTGLPSHSLFDFSLLKTLSFAQRHRHRFGLLFIHLDNITQLNQKWGFEVGDQLIMELANTIRSTVRDSDTVARYDGDLFAVSLDEIAKTKDTALVAQMLLFKLTQKYLIQEHAVIPDVSIGVAIYPEDADKVETLVHYAQIATQNAQANGGNCCYFYNALLQHQFKMS